MKRKIFFNGKIFKGRQPLEEAFVVENGKFLYVGNNERALSFRNETSREEDLQGAFVCPGFNDSHMHLLNYGYTLTMVDLKKHTDSLEELKKCLREALYKRKETKEEWLRGRGWNQDYFSGEKRFPDRWDLDEVSLETPICITRACGHCCVVNSKALQLMGYQKEVPKLKKGTVETDRFGIPNGIFREEAMELVWQKMPKPGRDELKQMIREAAIRLNSCGITSCQTDDFTAFEIPGREILLAYQELKEEGKLTLRINQQFQLGSVEKIKEFQAEGWKTGTGDEWLRIGPLKLVADGSLGSRSAYLSRSYQDDPQNQGTPLMSQKELNELIEYAHTQGMQIAVHAIGDGILDRVLIAYEKAMTKFPRTDHRHGIVHCQITRKDQLMRIQEQKLCVYAQPIFLDYDMRIVKQRVGEELAGTSYAFHSLRSMGVHLSSGTDCPVESPEVFPGIQCAVTRKSLDGKEGPYREEEAMSVEEAILSYTEEGAYSSFEEEKKGRIQKNMAADFVVLSQNPFETAKENLKSIQVVRTYLAGNLIYERK